MTRAFVTIQGSRRSRLAILALVALVLTLGLSIAACSSSSADCKVGGSTSADITIKDFDYEVVACVKPGARVVVHNIGTVTHTVTADFEGFNVTLDSGKNATFTAPDKAGEYKFHCNIHSQMKGTLTVE